MKLMYAVVRCDGCKRTRMIDRSTLKSKCPFCGLESENRKLAILYEDSDQSAVRDALNELSGFTPEEKDKSKITNADPLSSLVYKYEHCTELDLKMELLAKGLTEIHGTFTLEDILEVDPRMGKKMLEGMLEQCLVAEVKYGVYRG